LIRDTKTINLSTERTASELQNGNYKSNAKYDLGMYVDFMNDETIAYVTVSVPYVVIPNSTYIINENNNRLDISANNVTTSYYFPLGNYNTNSFIQQFYVLLSSTSWNVTVDTLSSRFIFRYATYSFEFLSSSTINYVLGFNETVSSSLTQTNGYYVASMPLVYNFLPIPNYVLHMNVINNGITLGSFGTQQSADVLLSVPNNGRNNAQTIYESGSNNEFLLKNWDIRNLQLRITDTKNRELNFNGVSSYFTLRFNIYRTMAVRPKKFNEILIENHNIEVPYLEVRD
jgi:uncharacterized protein (DUF427 family)